MNARLPSPLFLAVCHIAVTEVAVQAQANYVLLAEHWQCNQGWIQEGAMGACPPQTTIWQEHMQGWGAKSSARGTPTGQAPMRLTGLGDQVYLASRPWLQVQMGV